jgi:hypothetical protein
MRLFYHTVDVQRMATTGQGISKEMTPLYTGIQCNVQPADNQTAIDNGWNFGQAYNVFFDDGTDIKKGDKILFGGMVLIVQGTKPFTGLPRLSHVEVLCQKEEQ